MFAVTGLAFVESSSTDDKNNCTASKGLFFIYLLMKPNLPFESRCTPSHILSAINDIGFLTEAP